MKRSHHSSGSIILTVWHTQTQWVTSCCSPRLCECYTYLILVSKVGIIKCIILDRVYRIWEGELNRKMAANRDVIEYPLAMLWRHKWTFTRKLRGFETTIVITSTILKLNSRAFLMTSTILLLKLLMFRNNSLRVTVLSLWRSKV